MGTFVSKTADAMPPAAAKDGPVGSSTGEARDMMVEFLRTGTAARLT